MLWLGNFTNFQPERYLLNLKSNKLRNLKDGTRLYNLQLVYSFYNFKFFFTNKWSLIIMKKKSYCYYFFSKIYFFSIILPKLIQTFKVNPQSIILSFHIKLKSLENFFFFNLLSLLFLSFSRLFFQKLKFKGKGYYLYKSFRNTITPQFGYAHSIYKYNYLLIVKFLSKTKVLFFGLSKFDISNLTYILKVLKPINVFTGRGIRFSKQIIYKKTGKVSLY